MNYDRLPLEELEELFSQQFNHHFELTQAVRASSEALTSIMKAVTAKREQQLDALMSLSAANHDGAAA